MKKGFTSLYLVMILSVLMLLLLSVSEAASAAAARASAENVCISAGRSVLSEYQPQLCFRYGIFAFRAYDYELGQLAKYYIDNSLKGRGVVKLSCESCSVNSGDYPGLDRELFKEQVLSAGKLVAVSGLASAAADIASLLSADLEVQEAMRSGSLSSLEALSVYSDAEPDSIDPETGEDIPGKPDSPGARATRREASRLLGAYQEALSAEPEGKPPEGEGRHVPGSFLPELPTAQLGVPSSRLALLSGGILNAGAESLLIGEYILSRCSNSLRIKEDSLLRLEAEYMLYGLPNDDENFSALRKSLFALRFSADLAAIFADPEKMAEISSVAAGLVFIPAPVAIFVLASIEAAAAARVNILRLFEGKTAPLIPALPSFGSYEDHLRILLFGVPDDVKLARLMDIMQMNIALADGKAFSFRDYAYGFRLSARLSKNVRWAKFLKTHASRKGDFEKDFVYK